MATLVSQIIEDAYREANLIAVGESPTTAQQTEGLRLYNRFITSLFGNEMGSPLEILPFGNNNVSNWTQETYYYTSILNYFFPTNYRLKANLEQAESINLYPHPEDGARIAVSDASGNFSTYNLTLVGNGSTIEGATSVVLSTDSTDTEWFYRSDLSDWKKISDLLTTDVNPFPQEFDEMFIIGLAIRLASRYGVEMANTSMMLYSRALSQFRSRYSQTIEESSEMALLLTPGNRRHNYFWSHDGLFAKGGGLIYGR